MFEFNFQLFAETLDIPGIDEDILKELAEEQETQETTESVEPAEEVTEPEPSADADSDNKQVEEADEYEDVKEGQTIPYDRFKSVNDRRKTAENRIKELEEQLKLAQTQHNIAEPKQQEEQVKATPSQTFEPEQSIPGGNYTKEQEQRIYELALKNLQKKNNYTDEDMEAFLYADGMEKMRYEDAVRAEVNAVKVSIQQYQAEQKAFASMTAACSEEFENYNKKLQSYQDVNDRWNYIAQERFVQLPQRKQQIINDAFLRLKAKQGTYADIELVKDYFDMANEEWEQAHAQGTKPKPSNKFTQAQKLPKAPGINGASGADGTLTPDRIAQILNTPGAWEKLSPKEQEAILSGRI